MVSDKEAKTLVHFVERLTLTQCILALVVAGFEPPISRIADGSTNRHAIRPVDRPINGPSLDAKQKGGSCTAGTQM